MKEIGLMIKGFIAILKVKAKKHKSMHGMGN